MSPERWQRVTAIFEAALDLPPEGRRTFVELRSEGDPELRAAVERLLTADEAAAPFLARPALEAAGLVAPPGEPKVIGRYEILERIGHGGFGDVFKARDPELKRLVAVKTCRFRTGALKERFAREAEIAAGLEHPNITVVHDVGVDDDGVLGSVPFLVQEFLSGEDLDQVIGERRPLSLATRLGILIEVAAGLAYAHSKGVVHRDIKPGNLRWLANGRVKIMDFGIAKLADAGTALTYSGAMMGTVAYMSPEQIRGEEVDARSDIFSFGVLAHELLALRCPFSAATQAALMYQVLHDDPPRLDALWPECPKKLAGIVERCLAKRLGSRFPGVAPLLAELEAVLSSLTPAQAAETFSAATAVLPRSARPRPWPRGLGWVAAAGLATLALVWGVSRRSEVPDPVAAPPAGGQLKVDALPWGEVVALTGPDGRPAGLGPQRFTPLVFALPPGRYTVTLRHPRASEPRSCEVEVVSGASVGCAVEFARVDVKTFLDQVGF